MENEGRESYGEIDPSGDIVSPEEGIRWAREALSRLPKDPRLSRDVDIEYSASLVREHEQWLQSMRAKRA
jgi:hypothetical protein